MIDSFAQLYQSIFQEAIEPYLVHPSFVVSYLVVLAFSIISFPLKLS